LKHGCLGLTDLVEIVFDEGSEHGQGVDGLIHGHHVAGIGYLKEVEVSGLLQFTSVCTGNFPIGVFLRLEISLALPFSCVSPGFSSSPVADPILVSRVDQYLQIGVVEERTNLGHQVSHPVSEKESVDEFVTLNPLSASNSKNFLDYGIVH
jgi:hypothetical protein